ncbi:MAG: ABC transporter substrate-binding protein [Chloroflexi bacterium]|nr:ABC transporter substrate-binding protein [Chloroflexota bacterium]
MFKKLLLVVVVLSLLIPAAACAPEPEPEPEPETIKIGCVLELTGPLAHMGEMMLDGAKMAVEEINAAGGVLGKQLELLAEDGATDAAIGFDRVKKLVEIDGVQAIIGPMITPTSELSMPYAKVHQIPLITMSATGVQLSEVEGTEWYFRTCLRDDAQALVLADFVLDAGYTKLATMVLDNTYGIGLETAIIDGLEAKEWQGEHVATIHYDMTKKDYRTELGVIRDSDPDVVLAVTYGDDGIIVFKQALEMGLDEIAWLGCDGNYGSALFAEPSSAEFMEKAIVAGTRTVGLGTLYEQFVSNYTDKFGAAPETYCDTTYDAVWAIAKAIEAAGVYDGEAIKAALIELEFDGVTGPIAFNELGDRTAGAFEIWEVVEDATTATGYNNASIEIVTWSM